MNLNEKACLMGLYISQWTGRKNDKTATKKVSEDFGNREDAATVHKSLVAKEALKKIQQAANDARSYFYSVTLPWSDEGKRIAAASNYMTIAAKLRQYDSDFWNQVDTFCDNYPELVAEARLILNGLFNSSDYPSIDRIRAKFAFTVTTDPLPTAEDFRVSLQQSEVDNIKDQINNRLQDGINKAMSDAWQRLYSAVSCVVDRLSQPEAIFRDSLIGNIQELVDVLPHLNITGDANLETMRRDVEDKLLKDPQSLRDDKDERRETAKDAKAILEAMSAYMGQ